MSSAGNLTDVLILAKVQVALFCRAHMWFDVNMGGGPLVSDLNSRQERALGAHQRIKQYSPIWTSEWRAWGFDIWIYRGLDWCDASSSCASGNGLDVSLPIIDNSLPNNSYGII